jgi:hypothetical protein
VLETNHPRFWQGIDMHQLAAISFGSLKRSKHARVVAAGVLPNHEDGLRLIEILKPYRSLPDADRLVQRGTTRFVAHI